jgi:hypothetical protein
VRKCLGSGLTVQPVVVALAGSLLGLSPAVLYAATV